MSSLIKAILYASITYLWIVSKTKIESRTKSIQFYLSIFINIMKKLHGQRDEHIVKKKITKTLNRFFSIVALYLMRVMFSFFSSRMRTPEREKVSEKKIVDWNWRKLIGLNEMKWNDWKKQMKSNEFHRRTNWKKNGFILTFSSTNIRTELRRGYWLKKGNRCWYKLFYWKMVL